jgi:coproporphyrinogen III oxidase-like Fe-S oxidoreductase
MATLIALGAASFGLQPDSQEWEYRAAEAWIACYDTGRESTCRKVCLTTRSSVRRHMVEALCLEKIVEDHFKQGGTWIEKFEE